MLGNIPAGLRYEEGLAVAILALAARDLRSRNQALRRDALAFWGSPWCDCLLVFVGLEPGQRPQQ